VNVLRSSLSAAYTPNTGICYVAITLALAQPVVTRLICSRKPSSGISATLQQELCWRKSLSPPRDFALRHYSCRPASCGPFSWAMPNAPARTDGIIRQPGERKHETRSAVCPLDHHRLGRPTCHTDPRHRPVQLESAAPMGGGKGLCGVATAGGHTGRSGRAMALAGRGSAMAAYHGTSARSRSPGRLYRRG